MKRTLLLILGAVGLAGGCVTPDGPTYTYRDIAGNTTDLIVDNILETKENEGDLLWLNASRIADPSKRPRYYLEIRYETVPQKGWLHIPAGPSLVLRVDGEKMSFSGPGSASMRQTTPAGTLLESAVYPVTAEQLTRLSSARNVEVEVLGSDGTRVYRKFAPQNTARFMEFMGNHVNRDL